MNTGIPYELVAKALFQEMLDEESVNASKVEHNVVVRGRTGTHQLDLRWRFSIAGIQYTTIVQAKNWDRQIDKDVVRAFRTVLDDLPGQPRGVLITKTGFQAGAKSLAKGYGIQLYLLREPNFNFELPDLATAKIEVDVKNRCIRITVFQAIIQAGFVFVGKRTKLPWKSSCNLTDLYVVHSEGIRGGTLRDLVAKYVLSMEGGKVASKDFNHHFEPPIFLKRKGARRSYEVAAISVNVSIELGPEYVQPFSVEGVVDYILEDLITGKKRTYRHSPKTKQKQAKMDQKER